MTPQSARPREFAAVIGDIVGSRDYGPRARLQKVLKAALSKTNQEVMGYQPMTTSAEQMVHHQPLTPTVGDEFQGLYSDLGSAIHAALLVRLHLFDKVDVRFGVGWGPLEIFEAPMLPYEQDGPAWWAAREAIESIKDAERQQEIPRGWRTACAISKDSAVRRRSSRSLGLQLTLFQAMQEPETYDLAAGIGVYINSFLLCRDELLSQMTDRDARILMGLLSGLTQSEIARKERISQPAVSQRGARSGIYAVLQAHRALQNVSEWNLLAFG